MRDNISENKDRGQLVLMVLTAKDLSDIETFRDANGIELKGEAARRLLRIGIEATRSNTQTEQERP